MIFFLSFLSVSLFVDNVELFCINVSAFHIVAFLGSYANWSVNLYESWIDCPVSVWSFRCACVFGFYYVPMAALIQNDLNICFMS